jgi:tRNA A58 N-methylase Trm61
VRNKSIVAALAALALGIGWLTYSSRDIAPDLAPFFPTPMNIVGEMLRMAEVKSTDVVYDLGCGDGRIVITAAATFGAKGVGVEYDPEVAQLAIDNVQRRNVDHLVDIVIGDATKVDVSPASVVTLYLLPDTIAALRPGLERSLKTGSRVVSHNAEMPDWKPVDVRTIRDDDGRVHNLHLYEIGKHQGVR